MSTTAWRDPAAVLFDMDGLLVDTEPLWFDVEREIATDLGADWTHADSVRLVGGSLVNTVGYIQKVTGTDVAPEQIATRMVEEMTVRLRAGFALQPGAKRLLTELADAAVPRALVTSAQPQHMAAVLGVIGADSFTVTVCSADVTHLKPDAEPYLTAAARLGVSPERCVVLEDSLNGTLAGEAAGCAVVTVPSVVPVSPAPGRTIVSSLESVNLAFLQDTVRGSV